MAEGGFSVQCRDFIYLYSHIYNNPTKQVTSREGGGRCPKHKLRSIGKSHAILQSTAHTKSKRTEQKISFNIKDGSHRK